MKPLKPLAVIVALAIAALLSTSTALSADALDAAQATQRWWLSEMYIKELVLLPEQQKKIEDVFQKAVPKLKEKNSALMAAEAKFERLIEQGNDSLVMEQISVMEAARAELNTARTLMLYDMRKLLTPQQWAKFKAMHPQPPAAPAGKPK